MAVGGNLGADDMGNCFDGTLHIREGNQQAYGDFGQRNQLQHRLADDAQGAFGTDDQIFQTVAGGILGNGSAEGLDLTVGKHHGQRPDIVPGNAVLHRPHTAGVGGDIAADGGALFAGIRGIEEVILLGKGGKLHQKHTGLDGDGKVVGIQLQDFVHFGGLQQNAAVDGHRSAHQAGAAAPDGDGNDPLPGQLHNGGDLFFGLHPHQNLRQAMDAAQLIMGIVRIDGIAAEHIALVHDGL